MDSDLTRLTTALAGRYAIGRELGAGGMATVYLAEDLKHRRAVAIKVLRPELAALLGPERFLREIETVARLNHPRILALHDSGEAGGFLYYVMPFVRGESLRHRMVREVPLPVGTALEITRQVAGALDFAHAQGLIHRDIKPENILLHEGDAMVADFGISTGGPRPQGGRLTAPGLYLGTPGYMSPEQILGDTGVDGRSDQYSLACVLYEMLTGETPFAGAGSQAILARQLVDPAPSVRQRRAEVPEAVDLALQKALAREAGDRFGTLQAFAEALSSPVATPAPSGRRSVAVLPFLNLSSDPDNEYFADGITQDVIAQLSKVRSLKVISRASVMPFKQRSQGLKAIAAQLGVATVLDGSVRRAGDRVRIVAELSDAGSEEHLWSETYDRQLHDIFAIQSDVALQIVASLRAELSVEERQRIGREPTTNMEAYQAYLHGRHRLVTWTTEGMRDSLEHFRRALALDPGFAEAWVGIATAYSELAAHGSMPSAEAYAEARAAARRALALNPDLGEAHSILAYTLCADYDWDGAERAFARALQLNPGNPEAYDLLGRMRAAHGRFEEAIALIRRAKELDPLVVRADLATALLRAGRAAEAEEEIRPKVEADPNYARGVATLGWARFLQGNQAEGLALLERAAGLDAHAEGWRAQLGMALGLAGRREAALEILRQLEEKANTQYVSPYHLAYVYTGIGEHERALDQLERSFAERSGAISTIKGSFLFRPLHGHPRFEALLRKMNLG